MAPVTVGIPFHDEEEFLERSVRSVLAQTFDDLEILLVDDGSTDRSLEIARSFDDPRIQVTSDGKRRFLGARLNEITRRARGELIARMDADDVAHPERLAKQVTVMREEPRCDAIGTWVGLVDVDEEPFAVTEASPLPVSPAAALRFGVFPHATMLARRTWHEANPYDEALSRAEDRDLWCRTAATSIFRVVPEPLYIVRVHASDSSFLGDYIDSQRQYRGLVARYGHDALGVRGAAQTWAAAHAKAGVMWLAVRTGLAKKLVRRRGRAPTAFEREMILSALRSVGA